MLELAGETKAPPSHWLYEVPESQAVWMIEAINRRRTRERIEIARLQGKAAAPDPNDPRLLATVVWTETRDAILKAAAHG